ncbi:hypothetical protein ACFWJT_32700 [Streptomyces sp. NPDC127069]|uniref:hypothetical protein n=1 Tax=Streptomyces sp. NPDC127069 TaxID=3347128 RepID=UPI003646EA55
MLTWSVRISGLLAFTAAAALAVWTAGLANGVPLPSPGLTELAWVVGGLVWLRVLALWAWWFDEEYGWLPTRPERPVSLTKGGRPGPLRRLADREYESTAWVFLRQSAVWSLVVVAIAAMNVLGSSHGSPYVRSLLQAGAAYTTATVAEVSDVDEVRNGDEELVVYHTTLAVTTPQGSRVRSDTAFTPHRPEPGDQVRVLWAPTAPELGGLVGTDEPLDRYLKRDWGPTLRGVGPAALALLLVLTCMLPTAVGAEADGLQEQAWSPFAQTVHAAAVTAVLAAVLPYLTGTLDYGYLGLAAVGLLALYIAMPIRALMA